MINFTIDRDKNDLYKFAALQSEEGQRLLHLLNKNPDEFESVILIKDMHVFIKSTAALMISKTLSGPIKIIYPFIFLPKFIRDFIYDLIAKNRYKIFGKRDVCRVPTEAERGKFL